MSKTPKARPGARHSPPTPHTLDQDTDAQRSEADDESGNRALHSVATGPNPNVGRDDVERPSQEPGRNGGVEST